MRLGKCYRDYINIYMSFQTCSSPAICWANCELRQDKAGNISLKLKKKIYNLLVPVSIYAWQRFPGGDLGSTIGLENPSPLALNGQCDISKDDDCNIPTSWKKFRYRGNIYLVNANEKNLGFRSFALVRLTWNATFKKGLTDNEMVAHPDKSETMMVGSKHALKKECQVNIYLDKTKLGGSNMRRHARDLAWCSNGNTGITSKYKENST